MDPKTRESGACEYVGGATLPATPIDGATLPGDKTLTPAPPDRIDLDAGLDSGALDADRFDARYDWRARLGEGGMGEVRLYKDTRVGREVAVKMIRTGHGTRSDLKARFLREARVQGQLEHPSVVPVYDLGLGPDGAVFFTMKRVRGPTLEEILGRLEDGDEEAMKQYSRHKLLGAFASVCLAVDFAHAHGVVHRDLKPDNVMLGDFGEVYVLDWGIAKVVEGADVEASGAEEVVPAKTAAGTFVGTLGYMAPEQLSPALGPVDARSDVYALGAILFEVLALEPLHAADTADKMVASTLSTAEARPSARAPLRDVPPELDAICVKATAVDRLGRYASARELHRAVERFLAGDRDVELRRGLALAHAQAAAEAAERALARSEDPARDRSTALRELGRALAFDPQNAPALRTLVRLIVEPPAEAPAVALERMQRARLARTQTIARRGAYVYLAWGLHALPMLVWLGVRDWPLVICACASIFFSSACGFVMARRKHVGRSDLLIVAASGALANAMMSRVLGPFILIPVVVAGQAMVYQFYPHRRTRNLAIGLACLGLVVPMALEWTGIMSPSYAFRGGVIVVLSHMTQLPVLATNAYVLAATLSSVGFGMLVMGSVREQQYRAELRLQVQTWQLEQLVPEPVRGASAAEPTTTATASA